MQHRHAAHSPDIAYCIVGQARGFTSSTVRESIVRNAIDALGGKPHVFLYLKCRSEAEMVAVRRAAHTLRPTAMRLRHYIDDEARISASVNATCGAWSDQRTIFGIQAIDQLECFRMVQESEARRGQLYDIIVRMRPDEQICERWPSYNAFNWTRYEVTQTIATVNRPNRYGGARLINDKKAIMARSTATAAFSAPVEALKTCVIDKEVACPWSECHLSAALRRKGLAFDNGEVLGRGRHCLWDSNTSRWGCDDCKPVLQGDPSSSSSSSNASSVTAPRSAQRHLWCRLVGFNHMYGRGGCPENSSSSSHLSSSSYPSPHLRQQMAK